MFHERFDQILPLRAVGSHVLERVETKAVAANVRFLSGIELRVHEKSVLEIVDSEFGGFFVSYGAQVSRDFEPAFVRSIDRGFQLCARDVHIGFEGRYAAIGPVFQRLPSIVRAGEVRHLDEVTFGAFQIGARHVYVGTRQLA